MSELSPDCTNRTDEVRRCPVACITNHQRFLLRNRNGLNQASICDLCSRLVTQRQWFDALFGGER